MRLASHCTKRCFEEQHQHLSCSPEPARLIVLSVAVVHTAVCTVQTSSPDEGDQLSEHTHFCHCCVHRLLECPTYILHCWLLWSTNTCCFFLKTQWAETLVSQNCDALCWSKTNTQDAGELLRQTTGAISTHFSQKLSLFCTSVL